jgi:hypothetical protein
MTTGTTDYYGRGMAFPLALGPTGGVREAEGVARIEQSIRIILGTQHGERVMRPDFGADLRSLTFAANTPETANLTRHLVETALARWEPRVEVLEVEVRNVLAEAALVITVSYRVLGTQDAHSLVQRVSLEVTP